MTRSQANSLLNRFEQYGLISGHDFIDDGPAQPEGERYWGNIYIDGVAAGAAMSDDPARVREQLVLIAMALILEGADYTVTEPMQAEIIT